MKRVSGVGLLLQEGNQFYAIEELVTKRGVVSKNKGELSIPLETMHLEETHHEAIKRLYVEEVDAHGVIKTTAAEYIGSYTFTQKHLFTSVFLYHARVTNWQGVPFVGSHGGAEYNPFGFVSRQELLRRGRKETKDIFRMWDFWLGHLE